MGLGPLPGACGEGAVQDSEERSLWEEDQVTFPLDEQEWVGHWAGRRAGAAKSQLAALPHALEGRGGLGAAAGTRGSARRSLLRSCCQIHCISFNQPLWTSHVTGLYYLI